MGRGGVAFAPRRGFSFHLHLQRVFRQPLQQVGQGVSRIARFQMATAYAEAFFGGAGQLRMAGLAWATRAWRRRRQARRTAEPTDETVNEPPCNGALGNALSPSWKRTSSGAMPAASAAIWVITV